MSTRTIAYKQASSNPNLSGILPDEFITEWTYTDLHAPGTLSAEDGWQFQDEADFLPRWESNNLLLTQPGN